MAKQLEAIRYANGKLSIINQVCVCLCVCMCVCVCAPPPLSNSPPTAHLSHQRKHLQLKLPLETEYDDIKSVQDGWDAIREMRVRGAPAIAIVAALSLAVELHQKTFASAQEAAAFIKTSLDHLRTSRPTAVNLFEAANKLEKLSAAAAAAEGATALQVAEATLTEIEGMMAADIADNKAIGRHGAEAILAKAGRDKVRVLTHCNTGSLATAQYGTALGVIRSLHAMGSLDHAFCTETRPYNQGARLTAYELVVENIPSTLSECSACCVCSVCVCVSVCGCVSVCVG